MRSISGGQRLRRGIEPHVPIAVSLHERPGIAGVGLGVDHAGRVGVQDGILLDGLEVR